MDDFIAEVNKQLCPDDAVERDGPDYIAFHDLGEVTLDGCFSANQLRAMAYVLKRMEKR